MAATLTLRFTDVGTTGTISVNKDTVYTFKNTRTGFKQAALGDTAAKTAENFYNAYRLDTNYLGESTINFYTTLLDSDGVTELLVPHGIVEITNDDNLFFDGFANDNVFISDSIATTPQVTAPTLTAIVSESATPCSTYTLDITTDATSGTIRIFQSLTDLNPLVYDYSDAPITVDLLKPLTANSGRVVLTYEVGGEINTVEATFTPPPKLIINSVDITGSPFGASININTNFQTLNNDNITYSLDGVDYQSSSQYTGLTAGNYTAYAQSYGCVQSTDFTITETQTSTITVEPYIHIAIHNSLRYAKRKPTENENDLLFLNYTAKETPGLAKPFQFTQNYLQSDTITTQFKSSYDSHKALLIDCDGVETEMEITQMSDNINRQNFYEGNITDVNGRIAVFFTSGDIYDSEGNVINTHNLNGLLPIWYKTGVYMMIEGIGATVIDSIVEVDEITYAVTGLDAVADQNGIEITTIHSEHNYEVYEFSTAFDLAEGIYQIRIEYYLSGVLQGYFLSEAVQVHETLEDEFLTVQWFNERNNDIIYNTGIRQLRRLMWENYFTLIPNSEKETYDTDTSVELVNSKSFATYELTLRPMPMEIARGLMYGFDNSSSIVINGAVFISQKTMELEPFGDMYIPKVQLTLTDQTMTGQQNVTDVVNTGFLIVEQNSDGTGFLLL